MANFRKLFIVNFLLVLTCWTHRLSAEDAQYKVCAIRDKVSTRVCETLESDQIAACVTVEDSVDCALKLKSGEANVAEFSAEQALLVAKYLNSSVSVVATSRHQDRQRQEFAFESVVVVKADFKEGDLKNLAGKQFCHPGFKFEETWSRRVLTEFESKVVPLKCGSSDSYAVEDEFKSLATFFGKSCRPGEWVPNSEKIDKDLKQKYKSLCELCDDKENCKYITRDNNPQKQALRCLTQLNGEVAYVGLSVAKAYFGVLQDTTQEANPADYRFLCPNGSLQSIATVKPCSWVQQPWPVVVASKAIENEFRHNILEANSPSSWQEVLKSIITPSDYILFENTTDIVSYVTQGREIPSPDTDDKCRRDMRWCVISTVEKEKCEWLGSAILTAGIRPGLRCILGSDTLDCFKKIDSGKADIISVDSNFGYIARKKYSLGPIFYHETKGEKSMVVAVIKNEDAAKYTKFADLKDKNVCLPEYGGIAYISTIVFGKNLTNSSTDNKCDYGAAISTYFANGCVPGARDKNHGTTDGTNADKLCSLCQVTELSKSSTTCTADKTNRFYGDEGALKCLKEGSGDIAFVERLAVSTVPDATNYRVLCRNNTLAAIAGFKVGENCALSATIDGETLTRNSDANKPAFELFLKDLETAFKDINVIKQSTFNMFATFNGQDNVMFKNNTIGFGSTDDPNNKYIKNYKELFSEVDHCTNKNSAARFIASIFLPIAFVVLLL